MFGHFADLGECRATKPVMIYFYWPEEDAESDDKNIANQVRRCGLMDEILATEEIRRASVGFHCFKCNIKEVNDELKKRYKITTVPRVLFFDVKGKKAWQFTNSKAKPKSIARKMMEIAAKSRKLLEKMNK